MKPLRTEMDTIVVTPEVVSAWELPVGQRPKRVNKKVQELAKMMADDSGIFPGVVTLAKLGRKVFLVDGQHRREAFLISGLKEGLADVRQILLDGPKDLPRIGEEFVRIQSHLVAMRPDDNIRALEASLPAIQFIREKHPFVGYKNYQRHAVASALSMNVVITAWQASVNVVPHPISGSAEEKARRLTMGEAHKLVEFLSVVREAWGSDVQYSKLWGALNLTVCAWLYRRVVLGERTERGRSDRLTRAQAVRAFCALSASGSYLDWLYGRTMRDRDRTPCYRRIKSIMTRRLGDEFGRKVKLPTLDGE